MSATLRVGTGFDAHRLVPGRKLVLGGVAIPHAAGLEGHSDGDCLLHAVCDALLGAAAAGDLGRHFPSSDPRFAGAASLVFLQQVARLLAERRLAVQNLDATVVAQEPALAPHLEAMRASIAAGLGIEIERVSVKAKSTDRLGAIGRGEGIAAEAVALVRESSSAPLRVRGTAGGARRGGVRTASGAGSSRRRPRKPR